MGQIVLDHDDLAKRLKGLKVGGKRVVVTNGCFDLLHVGHIRCLVDAAKRGDCLVVALNSDASVRGLKGGGRPVQPQMERAEILAAIDGVAYVTIFDEASVGPLLRKLRPSLLAKGTDYTLETLPEKDVLAEIGAELVIVGDPKNHSTKSLLKHVHAAYVAQAPAPKGKGGGKAEGAAKKPAPRAMPAKAAAAKAGAAKPAPAKAPAARPAKAVKAAVPAPAPNKKKVRGAASQAHA